MTFYAADSESSTVGEILRETRMKRGLELETVAEETKISPKHLLAMEDGDLASLPAEVYARGYYSMYARMLALDPGEVLEMYGRERRESPKTAARPTPPPNRLAQNMASLAERPTSPPSSSIGLIIFIFLLFGAFLCWYFGWNPASYLSEKLRSLEDPQRQEQVHSDEPEQDIPGTTEMSEISRKSDPLSLFSPSPVTAATTRPENFTEAPDALGENRIGTTGDRRPAAMKALSQER